MVPSASIPAVRQNRSKLTETASQAFPTAPIPVGGEAIDVVLSFFMALLSFVDSTPRAYRLKASNAAPPISTFPGAIPLVRLGTTSSHQRFLGGTAREGSMSEVGQIEKHSARADVFWVATDSGH